MRMIKTVKIMKPRPGNSESEKNPCIIRDQLIACSAGQIEMVCR